MVNLIVFQFLLNFDKSFLVLIFLNKYIDER